MQYKQPLIIHTFSPEVIQTNSNDFMTLVQRLTGRASYVSPPSKRRRLHTLPHLCHASDPAEVGCTSSVRTPLKLQQEEHDCMSELATRRGLSPRVRLGLNLERFLSPHSRVRAGMQGRGLMRSPAGFEFSPSTLPTPPAFLQDFPSLSSPYVQAAGLPSPVLKRVGDVGRSSMASPLSFPSPGPLTSAFLADLPVLSPAAQSWIEKHPLSAELMLSPLSRGFGLPSRPAELMHSPLSSGFGFPPIPSPRQGNL